MAKSIDEKGPAKGSQKAALRATKDGQTPHGILFSPVEAWQGATPADQLAMVREFDDFASVIRLRFGKKRLQDLDRHFNRLLGSAQVTFNETDLQLALGKSALQQHRFELEQEEGGAIKSEQFRRTAVASLIAAIIIWALAISARVFYSKALDSGWVTKPTTNTTALLNSVQWPNTFTPCQLAIFLTGALLGLCISFYIRNPQITFEQLRSPQRDLTTPGLRVVVVTLISFILALLFQQHAMGVSVATISTEKINDDALSAIIVGVCCGMSELAIIKKLSDFAASFMAQAKTRPTKS